MISGVVLVRGPTVSQISGKKKTRLAFEKKTLLRGFHGMALKRAGGSGTAPFELGAND